MGFRLAPAEKAAARRDVFCYGAGRRGGAGRVLQVLHRKYALGLGWSLRPFATAAPAARPPDAAAAGAAAGAAGAAGVTADAAGAASRCMMSAVLDRAEDVVRRAAADFSSTFASSFAQGTLLAARYLLLDAPLPAAASRAAPGPGGLTEDAAAWRAVMVRALGLMGDVAAVAIGAMAGCPPVGVGGGGGGGRPLVVGGAAVSTCLFGSMYRKTEAGGGDGDGGGRAGAAEGLATPHSVQRNLVVEGVGAGVGGAGGTWGCGGTWGGGDMLRATQRNTEGGTLTAQEATATHAHGDSMALLRRWAVPGAGKGAGGGSEAKEALMEGMGMGGDGDVGGDEDGELGGLGPREQLVVVSCWLSLKEAALVLGGLVGRLRLDEAVGAGVVWQEEVEWCGGLLVDMVFSTLHNGAIEKARLGFQARGERERERERRRRPGSACGRSGRTRTARTTASLRWPSAPTSAS